jgi:hypothetical protein
VKRSGTLGRSPKTCLAESCSCSNRREIWCRTELSRICFLGTNLIRQRNVGTYCGPCSRNWSSALILINTGCAIRRQAWPSRSSTRTTTSTRTIDQGSKAFSGKSSREDKIFIYCNTTEGTGRISDCGSRHEQRIKPAFGSGTVPRCRRSSRCEANRGEVENSCFWSSSRFLISGPQNCH